MSDSPAPQKISSAKANSLAAWSLVGEIGLILALPLVVAVLLGIKLDRYFQSMPLFTIVGLILAAVISTLAIARKIKRLS